MNCSARRIRVPVARRPPANRPVADGEGADCRMTGSVIGVGFACLPRETGRGGAGDLQRTVKDSPEGSRVMSTIEPSAAIEVVPIEDSSLLAFYRDMNL